MMCRNDVLIIATVPFCDTVYCDFIPAPATAAAGFLSVSAICPSNLCMNGSNQQMKRIAYYAIGSLLIIYGTRSLWILVCSMPLLPTLSADESKRAIVEHLSIAVFALLGAVAVFLENFDETL